MVDTLDFESGFCYLKIFKGKLTFFAALLSNELTLQARGYLKIADFLSFKLKYFCKGGKYGF